MGIILLLDLSETFFNHVFRSRYCYDDKYNRFQDYRGRHRRLQTTLISITKTMRKDVSQLPFRGGTYVVKHLMVTISTCDIFNEKSSLMFRK